MSIGSEFKEFAMKGNVVDMAVGIIIGAAFGKIVSSLVADVLMPPPTASAAAAAPPRQEVLLEEIRNLLAKR